MKKIIHGKKFRTPYLLIETQFLTKMWSKVISVYRVLTVYSVEGKVRLGLLGSPIWFKVESSAKKRPTIS
jgi:hypothetical protein